MKYNPKKPLTDAELDKLGKEDFEGFLEYIDTKSEYKKKNFKKKVQDLEKAYKDNIKTARKLAYQRGQKDEQEYFNTHAVVRLLKAGLASAEGKFIPGAKVNLAVELGNFVTEENGNVL